MITILIVDDHEQNRYLLRSILVASGYDVLEAGNGTEALELTRRTRPDLIISDILMPQMDGFALCRACKLDEQLRDIPFVFYTATYTDPRDEALAMKMGAARFIVKPIEGEVIIAIVCEVLQAHAVGQLAALPPALEEETAFYRLYNEALIRKLEDKMLDLEQLNRRLAESEERFRRLAENAPDLIYRYEFAPQRRFTYVSPAARVITGYTPEEHYADPDLGIKIVYPADRLLLEATADAKTPPDQPLTLRWYHKEGRIIWIEQRNVRVFDEAGELVAIEGIARDITERKQYEHELEVIVAVSAALRMAQTRAEMLPVILDQLLSVLDVDGAALEMLDQTSDEMRTELGRGAWASLTGKIVPAGAGLSALIVSTGQPYLNNDARNDPRNFRPDVFSRCSCAAGAPLVVQGQIIGILWIGRAHPMTDHDLHLLTAIANMTSHAIHRSALHEETTHRVEQLQALQMIDRAITTRFDLEETLNVLLEHVATQLKVDAAAVLLLDQSMQTLSYAAGCGFRTLDAQIAHIRMGEMFSGRAALEQRIVYINDFEQIQESPKFAALWVGEGFTDFLGVPLIVEGKVKGVLEVYHRTQFHPDSDWINFLETLAGQAAIAIDNKQLFDNMQRASQELIVAYDTTIEGWSHALDLRHKETEGHSQRVTEITLRLAKASGISDAELIHIRRGALLHDIGKMGVPDSILLKPDSLTVEEWKLMRMHPQLAYDLLTPIEYLHPAIDIPYCHHEKWDGTGYPRGLKGEQIPLVARIFSVVDVWDALTSDRLYRKAWTKVDALVYLQEQVGKYFDPKAVDLFLRVMNEKELKELMGAG